MARVIPSSGWRPIWQGSVLMLAALAAACADEGAVASQFDPGGPVHFVVDLDSISPAAALTPPMRMVLGAPGDTVVLGFENIGNRVMVGSYYASLGATFDSAQVLSVYFNTQYFPPRSGNSVATALITAGSGAFTVRFAKPVKQAGMYVTGQGAVTVSCYDKLGGLLGKAKLPGANLKGTGSAYPPNYPLFVNAPGIVRCVVAGTRNTYTIDDLTFVPEASGKLTLKVNSDSVGPVLAEQFDAVTQVAVGADGTADPRLDRVTLTIGPDSTGNIMPGAQAWVIARPMTGSGGHDHGGASRPRGTFFLPTDAGQFAMPTGGSRDSIRVTLSSTGTANLVYRTSGVSGTERLVVRLDAPGAAGQDSVLVRVRYPGLVELAAGPGIGFSERSSGHPSTHWGTPPALAAFQELGDSVASRSASYALAPVSRRPRVTMPGALTITDLSLAWGGLLDGGLSFASPQRTHRTGTEADLEVSTAAGDELLAEFINQLWVERWGRHLEDERAAASHIHLYTR